MELSSFVGKRILSPTGKDLGYSKSVLLTRNRKKISCLVCIDGDEEEFYLPARAVLAAGDVIIAGPTRLSAPAGIPCPVGLPVYSNLGESLGTVVDLVLGEGDPVYLVGKDGVRESYPAERLTVSETVIAYPEGVKKRAAARKKRADKRDATPAPEKEEAETAPIDPFDRFNLLGRTVKKSVYDGCGKPIALAGERVTPAVLSDARRKNLLLQLTVNTLTNLY